MKAPVVLVSVALALAILLAASFLIATGTRGENVLRPLTGNSPGGWTRRAQLPSPIDRI